MPPPPGIWRCCSRILPRPNGPSAASSNTGVPEGDLRLYGGEETLRIASRLQQERSVLARAINEVVVDRALRERWLANARAGASLLWIYAPTKDRATRLVGLLADYRYGTLRHFGEDGVEDIEGTVR
jgi:hypothetical protein